ncbi:hypothetical protein [uncultured Aquitalea sp.]|uniref:hypothetical protein n=1 Tax=uncultured Aquitalea sp. TaxID=540272 RepID=UPI0025DE73B7|nr:hypothetical protein [uncultured Aquitalea sp.]
MSHSPITPSPALVQKQAEAETALATYQQARQDWQAKAVLFTQQQQAAEAAEASAQGFKEQARALLRQVLGKNTKELQALRAEERAAYSQAEDFRSLLDELELARDEAELAMLEAGQGYLSRRNRALEMLADAYMAAALQQIDPLLTALSLREDALNREGMWATWRQTGYQSAIDMALHDLAGALKQRVANFKRDDSQEPIIQALPWQDGLTEAGQFTLSVSMTRQRELETRKQELNV